MGIISRKFARAYCPGEEERKEKDRERREDLAERIEARREERRIERERINMLPEQTKRNLKCAKVFLATLSPLSAVAACWSMKGLLLAAGAAAALSVSLVLSKWKKMAAMPLLAAAAGIIVGLVAGRIWRV